MYKLNPTFGFCVRSRRKMITVSEKYAKAVDSDNPYVSGLKIEQGFAQFSIFQYVNYKQPNRRFV